MFEENMGIFPLFFKQIKRTQAESQWIVATKATLPLTIPGSNSSRLHAIYLPCLAFTMRP